MSHDRLSVQSTAWSPAVLRWLTMSFAVVCFFASGSPSCRTLHAEEPFDRFVEALKERRLFDMALIYLDQQAKLGSLPTEIGQAIELERALLTQQLALTQRSDAEREAKQAEAEASFQKFLQSSPDHSRRSEARLALANIYLSRGEKIIERVESGSLPQEKRADAKPDFQKSFEVFTAALNELGPRVKDLSGANVDPADTEKVALRDRLRLEYSQAQLLTAYSTQRIAETNPVNSEPWKTGLAEAEKQFTDIYLKKTRGEGVRNLAVFYRAGIQNKLGKTADAIDSYLNIAEREEIADAQRILKTQAVTELTKLWSIPGQEKLEAAYGMASRWVEKMLPAEANDPAWLALRLETARVALLSAKQLKSNNGSASQIDRLEDDARSILQQISRLTGKHQEDAKRMLADMGVKVKETAVAEKKTAGNFSEALTNAQSILSKSDTSALTIEILQNQLAETADEAEKAKIAEQIAAAQKASLEELSTVIDSLNQALRQYTPEDDRGQLQQARFLLAYSYLKQEKYWEAITAAEFTSRTSAGDDTGLRAGNIALIGYQFLLKSATPERQVQLTGQLQSLAEYLLKTWPEATESQQAATLLVQLALINQQWEKAQEYIKLLPVDSPGGGKARRQLGVLLWDQYVRQQAALPSKPGVPKEIPADLLALRSQAEKTLEEGTTNVRPEEADQLTAEASTALIRIYLQSGKIDQASALLERPGTGPLSILQERPDVLSQSSVGLNILRTALQVTVARLGSQADPKADIEKVNSLIVQLRDKAGGDEAGQKMVSSIFVSLARDLQQQLEAAASSDTRRKLAAGIAVVLREVRKDTKDRGTLQWVGQTFAAIGKSLSEGSGTPSPEAKALLDEGVATLQDLLKSTTEKDSPESVLMLRFRLAQTYQSIGNFESAISTYGEILRKNNSMLDVQVEAARALQEWSNGKNSALLEKAIAGDLPDPKTRRNVIWGWGRISQLSANKPNLIDTFFQARLELSRCRFQLALLQPAGEQRDKVLQSALGDIKQTWVLFPDLGGKPTSEQFDLLLREIQKQQKQPETGLQALGEPSKKPAKTP